MKAMRLTKEQIADEVMGTGKLYEAERWDIYRCCGFAERMPITKEKIEGWAKALGVEIRTRYAYSIEGIPYYCVDSSPFVPLIPPIKMENNFLIPPPSLRASGIPASYHPKETQ